MTDRRAATLGLAGIVLVTLAIFGDLNPFDSKYELRAQVTNATQLRPDNPVRVAGVQVGKVTAITPGPGSTSIVAMQLDSTAPAVRRDATVHIEPRLALEGNFAVRLSPGTPGAPELHSGDTVPLAQTSGPVQFDQVLSVFDGPTRAALQSGLAELSKGMGPADAPGSGADGLRGAVRELDAALGAVTRVARAGRGRRAGDLTRAVREFGEVTDQLTRDPVALRDIAANTRRVSAALVASDGALATSVRRLRSVLRHSPRTLHRLDVALPRARKLAVELKPALDEAPTALPAVDRLVRQLHSAAGPNELPRLTAAARPLLHDLPRFESLLQGMFPYLDRVGTCLRDKVVPGLSAVVPDGRHTTGRPAYQDLVHAFANLAAANPSFDANGRILRAVAAGGEKTLTAVVPPFGQVVAGTAPDIQGVAPVWLGPGVDLPWEPGADCRKQQLPDLTKRRNEGVLSGVQEGPAVPPAKRTSPQDLEDALRVLREAMRKAGVR